MSYICVNLYRDSVVVFSNYICSQMHKYVLLFSTCIALRILRITLRPEFLNRVDDVIMFRPLLRDEIKGIIRIQLENLQKQLSEQDIELKFSDYALSYLAERGFDPQYGARPLKRVIQKDIINMLSRKIIAGEVDKSKPLMIDVFDGVVVIRNNGNTPAGEAEADKED